MRHYLWYDTSNQLRGEMLYESGWPDGVDPSDPQSTHEAAVANRNHFQAQPGFNGIIEYTCPCPPEDRFCDCARQQVDDCYVDESNLVAKATIDFVIDDDDSGHNNKSSSPHEITGGTAFTLRLSAPDLPDGTQITLKNCAAVFEMLASDEVMTFAGGSTNTLNLTAPPAGVVGGVFANAEKLHPFLRAVVKGTA